MTITNVAELDHAVDDLSRARRGRRAQGLGIGAQNRLIGARLTFPRSEPLTSA